MFRSRGGARLDAGCVGLQFGCCWFLAFCCTTWVCPLVVFLCLFVLCSLHRCGALRVVFVDYLWFVLGVRALRSAAGLQVCV